MNLSAIDPASLGLRSECLDDQGVTLVDASPIVDHIQDRYQFPAGLFDDLAFFQASHKIVRAATVPLQLPRSPQADRIGIDFLRIDMANPRMTTAAAMTWARHATSNAVDTTPEQCERYVSRRPFGLQDAQHRQCTGRGFVFIRHLGHGLGVGFLESTRPDDENFGRVRSMFPRAFSDELHQTSPFGNPS